MTAIKRFLESNDVRRIFHDLAMRHGLRKSGGSAWTENVATIMAKAQTFYESLGRALATLPSEVERQELIEVAWREFRKHSLSLSPPDEQWPGRRLGSLEADWAWIAFDNRGKAIQVDRDTGQPVVITLKAAKETAGVDLKALSRTSGRLK